MEREESEPQASVAKRRHWVPNWYLFTLATLVIVTGVIVVILLLTIKHEGKRYYTMADAIECPGLTPGNCERKGCFYIKADLGPSCSMNKDAFGYRVKTVSQESDGPLIKLKSLTTNTPYGASIENVIFKLTYLTKDILRFQLKDADSKRYEVPVQTDFPLLQNQSSGKDTGKRTYEIVHTNETEIFHFAVKRNDGTHLWNTSLGALLMADQYLQIGSYLPSENVYGIGEHAHDTFRHSMMFKSWPLFAGDEPPVVPTNQKNLYGVHPFYTCLEKSGKSHGVLFLNSNAMEVTFMPAPAVSFRTIGGILDFFIFVGDNPEHVIQLYTSLIGRPMIPPYWGLGFQLSKYGYGKIEELKAVMERNRDAKIPQAVQYLDIDHMHEATDFTYDNVSFKGLPDLMKDWNTKYSTKWIIIQEPFIPAAKNSDYYTSGTNQSIFVKRSPSWKPDMFPEEDHMRKQNVTLGKVWSPYYVAFLDFFRNETKKWWKEKLTTHRKTIIYDGIWIDMNEPANFGTNEDYPEYCQKRGTKRNECWALRCPTDSYEAPPYNPIEATRQKWLSDKTICMGSVQGEPGAEYLHYDVHSLYGWSQTQPTVDAVQEITGTRSLVISRSTYPSSGRIAGHWLGDNWSLFEHMKKSIIGTLEFNLFGIPYVGADVCGFHQTAGPELCKRWMQLGAFYPYFRNHNGLEFDGKPNEPQDPAWYKDKLNVTTLSRTAIERRIRLNPYLYTLFYRAHVDGSTVVRPLFHEFPNEEETLNMATQFLWGKSLMIVPILEANQTTVPVYFPKDEWWFFNELLSVKREFQERYIIELETTEYIPIYVRGGSILPYGNYDWDNYPEKNNTRNLSLYIFPKDGKATGELFMDDGISIDTVEKDAYGLYEFTYNNCSLSVSAKESKNFNGTFPFLERVLIFEATGFDNVTGNYTAEYDKKCNCATVQVNVLIKDMKDLSWKDSKGNCPQS